MLHHDLFGDGPLVVLLHSGGMSGRQWRRLATLLAPSHRVVVPDLLGSGDNPRWPAREPFGYPLDVAALRELLDSLEAPAAHLVGHSYGGLLALMLARERPSEVSSLAVFDPTAFGVLHASRDERGLADLERVLSVPVFVDDERGGGAEWFEVFVDYWNDPGTWRALPAPARDSFLRVGKKVYLEAMSLLLDRTPASAYEGIAAPALLLGGERSPVAARRVNALLAEALPRMRTHVVAGAGHMGPISHAEEVNALVAAHIAAADARRPE